ncbi:hypothetical protein EDD22DRAFT_165961 [Suillus occidentalis]|nr:hypothetical protein EDD22DRAFT_165961 [Suillus occidentalis]
MYDHMMTLPEEIVFIWRRPKALSAILFLLNRYVALLSNICGLVMDFVPVSDEVCFILILGFMAFAQDGLSCLKYALYRQLAILLQTAIVCIIMTIRTYALYDCSKCLLAWMGIVMVALAGLACVGTFGHFSGNMEIVPGIGCNETFSKAVAARIGLAYVALLIFDIFIFILTVYRIYKTSSLLRFSLVTRRNIVDTIFCDGAIFFG